MIQTELAWAAGFFDGEGTIWRQAPKRSGEASPRGGRGYLRLSIQQTDRQVLDRFHAAVGGAGKVVGPYTRTSATASAFWAFQAASFRDVMTIVAFLWKFLSPIKRLQIGAAFAQFRAA